MIASNAAEVANKCQCSEAIFTQQEIDFILQGILDMKPSLPGQQVAFQQ